MKVTTTPFDLRAWRLRLNLTQRHASELVGLSEAAYKNAEYRCQDRPNAPCQLMLVKLCQLIELRLEETRDG